MRDYPKLFANLLKDCSEEAVSYVFVGVDESANRKEIFSLIDELVADGTIRNGTGLWREQRELSDGSLGYFYEGAARYRHPEGRNDVGKPIRNSSDADAAILDILVCYLLSYGKVVLLSEDCRLNKTGLRYPLRNYFAPLLNEYHDDKSCLVGLFKKGKTDIDTYCVGVSDFLKRGDFNPGYAEILI